LKDKTRSTANTSNYESSNWTAERTSGSYGVAVNAEWCKLQRKKFKSDVARPEALLHFDTVWTCNEYLCERLESRIKWVRFSFDPGG
jgi:hypothetical protein